MAKRVWLDILTPKEAHYFAQLYNGLKYSGHHPIITARDYDCTLVLLERKGLPFKVIGKHGGGSLRGKLKASLERQLELLELLGLGEMPDYCVSLASPEAARVAFGLGIKHIVSIDAPHAQAVCRLTLPLAHAVVAPACIPKSRLMAYGVSENDLVQYDGIDEVAWIKDLEPDPRVPSELGLREGGYVVIRPEEAWASYLLGLDLGEPTPKIMEGLVKEGRAIVLLPRYSWQRELAKERFGGKVILPAGAVDGPSLLAFAALAISGGGTMAREAALLGTPSITYFPLSTPIEAYLAEKGFPLWHFSDALKALEKAREVLRDPDKHRRRDHRRLLEGLESPIDRILGLIG